MSAVLRYNIRMLQHEAQMSRPPVERVRGFLQSRAPDVRVVEFDASTATAPLAAAAVGCELGAIVKSLLFLVDGQPLVALVAGDKKVDDRKLARLHSVGKSRVRIADAATVRRLTGYDVGGVPPFGHATALPVVIDASLGRYATVYAAAGAPHALFAIALPRLVTLSGGEVADIIRE